MGKPAARSTDLHTCPMASPTPHVGGPVLVGMPNVLIGGLPAATLGSACTCAGPPDVIVQGSASVLIGGRPAARMGDMTAHGGVIVGGCPTVLIGDVGAAGLTPDTLAGITRDLDPGAAALFTQRVALERAAGNGLLGCEEC